MKFRSNKKLLGIVLGTLLAVSITACGYSEEEEASKQQGIELIGSGDYSDAVDAFNDALSKAGGMVQDEEIDIVYFKAAAQFLAGDIEGSIQTYTDLINFNEKNVDGYYLRGLMYVKAGNIDNAIADFDVAVKMDSTGYERYLRIYSALSNAGDQDNANRYLDLLLQVDATTGEAYEAKGQALEIRGDYETAKTNYEKAVGKGLTDAYIGLARVSGLLGDQDAVTDYLEKFQSSAEMNSESYNVVGELALSQGNYEEALSAFQSGLALENVTNEQQLLRNEIIALEYTHDFATAKEKATIYVTTYPQDQEMLTEYQFLQTR